jgi:hypothetical protein
MLSTAWSRTDQFWSAWVSDDPSWLRLQATVDKYPDLLPADFLERERRQGEDYYKREYLGIPSGGHMSPFTWDMYERAIHVHVPRVPPGQAFSPPQAQAVPIINPFQHLKSFGGLQ